MIVLVTKNLTNNTMYNVQELRIFLRPFNGIAFKFSL